jgi:hypothetical protein
VAIRRAREIGDRSRSVIIAESGGFVNSQKRQFLGEKIVIISTKQKKSRLVLSEIVTNADFSKKTKKDEKNRAKGA